MLKVKLLSYTPNPEEVVASAAKLCYSQVGVNEIIEKLDDESTKGFISRLAKIKHLSPFEHATFTFAIEGVSRSLTHQLVRHRIASYSQQSQRYVKESHFEYIIPPSIKENELAKEIFIEHMKQSQIAYDKIVDELIYEKILTEVTLIRGSNKKEVMEFCKENDRKEYNRIEKEAIEDARYIFPNAVETKIVVTMNARSLMNFFTLRCCNRAQWEIRQMADQMLALVHQVAPAIFVNSGAPCTFGKCTEGTMSCGQPRKFKDIIGE